MRRVERARVSHAQSPSLPVSTRTAISPLSARLVCEGERQRHGNTEEKESGRERERLANRDRETAK